MSRAESQAQVKVDPRAIASAWSYPRIIVSSPTIKVSLWRDGSEERITVQARASR